MAVSETGLLGRRLPRVLLLPLQPLATPMLAFAGTRLLLPHLLPSVWRSLSYYMRLLPVVVRYFRVAARWGGSAGGGGWGAGVKVGVGQKGKGEMGQAVRGGLAESGGGGGVCAHGMGVGCGEGRGGGGLAAGVWKGARVEGLAEALGGGPGCGGHGRRAG